MPKHNFATLTRVSKIVHIITTTLCIQVDYTAFVQDKLGFHLVVNARCAVHSQHKDRYAKQWPHSEKPSPVGPLLCVCLVPRG
ncbi:unnamed protein product [Staurois parvus]|uniref:Secreted protein n=1 Tax=Staurois parvus TaxID=386267 RepID=A0ABN9BNZ5_9NEOB|nr:unnamed protein product [Staurois parvus]